MKRKKKFNLKLLIPFKLPNLLSSIDWYKIPIYETLPISLKDEVEKYFLRIVKGLQKTNFRHILSLVGGKMGGSVTLSVKFRIC